MIVFRRLFFQHATSFSLAAVAPHSVPSAQPEELTRRRAELIKRRDELDAKWLRIYQQLPEPYRAGRPYVRVDGFEFGPLVGWPGADDDEAIRLRSGVLVRRPSPSDLRQLFVQESAELSSEVAGERDRQRVGQFRKRCRAKRACIRESGLPTASDWSGIDQGIKALDVSILKSCGQLADKSYLNPPATLAVPFQDETM